MGAASRVVGREAGRGLLNLANLITAVAPVAADWNDSHIFNQRWPSHARFHGVVALTMTSSLAASTCGRCGRPPPTGAPAACSRPPSRWATGRRSLWRRWSGAQGWMTRRTRSPGSRACRSACWGRRPRHSPPSPAGCWIDEAVDTAFLVDLINSVNPSLALDPELATKSA